MLHKIISIFEQYRKIRQTPSRPTPFNRTFIVKISAIFWLAIPSQSTYAFSCNTKSCTGTVTQLAAYNYGRVRVQLDGNMTIGNHNCDWLTLDSFVSDDTGFEHLSSLLLLAHATGNEITLRPEDNSCDIMYVIMRSPAKP